MGLSYEACQSLDREGNRFVSWVDIRKDYFGVEWATDFVIHYVDGSMGIREIVTESMLSKRANIEKLEFSRRYWSSSESVKDWKNCTHEEGSVRICSLMLQDRFTELYQSQREERGLSHTKSHAHPNLYRSRN